MTLLCSEFRGCSVYIPGTLKQMKKITYIKTDKNIFLALYLLVFMSDMENNEICSVFLLFDIVLCILLIVLCWTNGPIKFKKKQKT